MFYYVLKVRILEKKKIILLKKNGLIFGKKHFKLITNLSQISKQLGQIKKGDKDIQAAIKETSKYSVKSSDYLTGNHEKDAEIVQDLEQGLYRKRMLSYGGLLKKKHKLLNLDDAEDGNLIQTSDEEKTTEEEQKAHSITAIWNFEKQNYFLKNL